MRSKKSPSEVQRREKWLREIRLEWYRIMRPFGTWVPAELRDRIPSRDDRETDAYFEPAQTLEKIHLNHGRVVPNRLSLLTDCLPTNSICCEVGTDTGRFSKKILELSKPTELHLIDLSFKNFARDHFSSAIDSGTVILHESDSIEALNKFPEHYFDWIYFDCGHAYDGASRHISVAKYKIKPTGMLAFNGYIFWSHKEFMCYGVIHAVNEFCLKEGWEIICLALHNEGYNDVVIRKIAE
jgi:hypothetical protein